MQATLVRRPVSALRGKPLVSAEAAEPAPSLKDAVVWDRMCTTVIGQIDAARSALTAPPNARDLYDVCHDGGEQHSVDVMLLGGSWLARHAYRDWHAGQRARAVAEGVAAPIVGAAAGCSGLRLLAAGLGYVFCKGKFQQSSRSDDAARIPEIIVNLRLAERNLWQLEHTSSPFRNATTPVLREMAQNLQRAFDTFARDLETMPPRLRGSFNIRRSMGNLRDVLSEFQPPIPPEASVQEALLGAAG